MPALAEIGSRRVISTLAVMLLAASLALLMSRIMGGSAIEIAAPLDETRNDSGEPFTGHPIVRSVIELIGGPDVGEDVAPTSSASPTPSPRATRQASPTRQVSPAGTGETTSATIFPSPSLYSGIGGTAGSGLRIRPPNDPTQPVLDRTPQPTPEHTFQPTPELTPEPTSQPTSQPTPEPTPQPTPSCDPLINPLCILP